ncbi:MAG: type II restriction endonuclease [Chloroflexi bacterium]|nr:type II restriction endonuclease [Chloroflexota bacterium]
MPPSSCPYRSARQKVYGLGYSLLVFVYEKMDDPETQTGRLDIVNTIFVDEHRTADFQTTVGIKQILENDGNIDDLVAFMEDRRLPVDDIQAYKLAEEILQNPPEIGYLTISNALQWRLQYRRVIEKAGEIDGIVRIR